MRKRGVVRLVACGWLVVACGQIAGLGDPPVIGVSDASVVGSPDAKPLATGALGDDAPAQVALDSLTSAPADATISATDGLVVSSANDAFEAASDSLRSDMEDGSCEGGCAVSTCGMESTNSRCSPVNVSGLPDPRIAAARYCGGPVVSHVTTVAVLWGSSVEPTVAKNIHSFFYAITDSNYLDWLDEYYSFSYDSEPIGRGYAYFGGTITITPSNRATSLTDTDVGNEIASQIRAGSLPPPTAQYPVGPSVYFVYFPAGVSITAAGCGMSCSPSGFCGCHRAATQTIGSTAVSFPFVIVPDLGTGACAAGCGSGTAFQKATVITSAQLADVLTDPYGTGWSPGIGSSCNQQTSSITASSGQTFSVQKVWSNAAGACVSSVPECQRTSDAFGIGPSSSGFAPLEIQTWWTVNGCSTSPSPLVSSDWCQKASEIYGIAGEQIPGYAPPSVQAWWTANHCATKPLDPAVSLCQRASDNFYVVAKANFGSAPGSVQTWWTASQCSTVPTVTSACQKAADLYGMRWSDPGFSSVALQTWWQLAGCSTSTTASNSQLCQNAANLYAITGASWGGAPVNVQAWWRATCGVAPPLPSCQGISELFGVRPHAMWGYAPPYLKDWWMKAQCDGSVSGPLFSSDDCQLAADTFAMVANGPPSFAPSDVQAWWQMSNCDAHPRNSRMKQFTNGG